MARGLRFAVSGPGGKLAEQDLVRYRIVEAHHVPDELSGLDVQCVRPGTIAIRRDAAASGFELRDERIVFGAYESGELSL